MKKNTTFNTIDFEIIWKSLHSDISKVEQDTLSDWLNESQSHRDYYKKAQTFYAKEEHEIASANIHDLRKSIEPSQIQKAPEVIRNWRWYASIAASFLLIALSVILYQQIKNEPKEEINLAHKLTEPTPGGKKAILHIEGEEKILLGQKAPSEQLTKNANQSFLNITGKSLTYKQSGDVVVKQHILETPRGGEFKLTLADGTKVWINAASKLTYPSKFSETERVVTLTGEAYFEVSHDSKRPFIINSGKQSIQVLGTAFNLSHYPNEPITSTLVTGQIQVQTETGASANLTSGEQAIYNQGQEFLKTKNVNTSHYTAWMDGLFYFNDESLEEIMQELSRWYNFEVEYQNEKVKLTRFTGTLKRYQSFQEVTTIIEMTGDVHFTTKGNKVIIE
jgi:ferric-dicitrate binding protein FerR (iron transport regulator)